jgi:hypothetical protein
MSEEEVELFEENVPEITVEAEAVQIIEEPQEITTIEEEVVVEIAPAQEVIPNEVVKVAKKISPRKWL